MEAALGPSTCPVCLASTEVSVKPWSGGPDVFDLDCANCGPHLLSASADAELAGRYHGALVESGRIAYGLRRLPRAHLVTAELLERLAWHTELPGPLERIDNVVLHLARVVEPGLPLQARPEQLRAALGCVRWEGVVWALRQAQANGWIDGFVGAGDDPRQRFALSLTARGWQRHAELVREAPGSRHAFMAMKFNDAELDALFVEHLRPAIRQTGFDLRRNDGDHKTAGAIDNRMRVEIRTCRFLLCDLSHGNQGAYWEAGFAEGLGRPVIYLCRRDTFAHPDPRQRPHFNIANQAIIVWDPADPAPAMRELKAMVRATLPAEARLEDVPDRN